MVKVSYRVSGKCHVCLQGRYLGHADWKSRVFLIPSSQILDASFSKGMEVLSDGFQTDPDYTDDVAVDAYFQMHCPMAWNDVNQELASIMYIASHNKSRQSIAGHKTR